jgi:hypothetical protein
MSDDSFHRFPPFLGITLGLSLSVVADQSGWTYLAMGNYDPREVLIHKDGQTDFVVGHRHVPRGIFEKIDITGP